VRADADAQVAAARGWASGEVAAARDGAQVEVARAHAAADDRIEQLRAAQARAASSALLSIPIAPLEIRPQTLRSENALNALQHIDQVLEIGMADDVDSHIPLDIDVMNNLVGVAQEHAEYLSTEGAAGGSDSARGVTASYAEAAAGAFGALLRRIDTVAERLRGRGRSPDAEIIDTVVAMLADPWVQHVKQQLPR
jgi:colicin import membrane protein